MKTSNKTKGSIFFLALMACFMLSTSSSKSFTKKIPNQVPATGVITVCHSGHNLKVTPASLDFHLRHGDRLGGCLADPR